MGNKKHNMLNHSASHLLAQAVLALFPKTKLGIGPAIEKGFYYDFRFSKPISDKDLPKIEKAMAKIIKQKLPFDKKAVPLKKAKEIFADQPFKLELINDLADKRKKEVSVYHTGKKFIDLCQGPHLKNTSEIKAFKLIKLAGAYWKGNEKNPMLTRIYGVAFDDKKKLENYLNRLQEAKKRDHRKLGKELKLFIVPKEVGPGLLIWLPNGAIIRHEIEQLIYQEQIKRGYQHVYSPHIGRKQLWVTSGHWALYRDKMYAPMIIDKEKYLVKPMNCPFHMMVYKSQPRSYRDLPLRVAEIASVYRYERPGELSGMLRVRYITQDDAHIFCRPDQVIDEFLNVFDYVLFLLKAFGIKKYRFRISLRDPKNKDKYLGNDKIWTEAENKISKAVKKKRIPHFKAEGEAAFYGPKLDVLVEDALGREWQCGTIQIDFMLPEKFKLEYTDSDGQKKRPVLIHRAPLGSLERWAGFLIEHYGGNFPVWLAPIQVRILPITEKQSSYGQTILEKLQKEGVRVDLDKTKQTLSYRIRQGQLQKIPFLLILGEKERGAKTVTIRQRGGRNFRGKALSWFIKEIKKLISIKSLALINHD